MRILFGEFNAKLWREVIFKPTIGIERIHQDDDDDDNNNSNNNNNNNNNNNGVRTVNFVTLINLVVKSKIFPHRNIHQYTLDLTSWKNS
jgi:hypothetical protein